MKLYHVLLLSFLPAVVSAHSFERTFGGAADDFGQSALACPGGYLLCGWTYSFGSGDANQYLVRTNDLGDTIWTRTYGAQSAEDNGLKVEPTFDTGFVVVGYSISSGRANMTLTKIDARGDSLWAREYGGSLDDMGYAVDQASDSGFIIVGGTYSFGAGRPNIYAVRTDAQGDTLWTRTYGGAGEEYAFSVTATRDSGFMLCGWTRSYGAGMADIYLIKTDARGDTEWTRTYGGAEDEYGHTVRQTADGGYIVAGSTLSYGAGDADFYLVRTDEQGDVLWARTYGGDTADLGHSVELTEDGGFIMAGQTSSFGAGNWDAWLVKTDSLGDTLWTQTVGDTGDDRCYSVQKTSDRGYIVAGSTGSTGAGGFDAWLVKTDSVGRVAVAEPGASPARAQGFTTIARGVLRLPSSLSSMQSSLFDASGRRVPCLRPGDSDIRTLSPGVYYVATGVPGTTSKAAVRKVIVIE
jgi:TolB-like protein